MPIQGDVPLLALMKDSQRSERQASELVFLAGQPNYFSDKAELLYSIKKAIASRYGIRSYLAFTIGMIKRAII